MLIGGDFTQSCSPRDSRPFSVLCDNFLFGGAKVRKFFMPRPSSLAFLRNDGVLFLQNCFGLATFVMQQATESCARIYK